MAFKTMRTGPPAETLKLLVVDDVLLNRMLVIKILESLPRLYAYDTAKNGQEAVEKWQEAMQSKPFDVIIMDVDMPIMNGLDATQTIRAHESKNSYASVRIIGFSTNDGPNHIELGLGSGMNSYLSKHCNRQTLLEAILNHPMTSDPEILGSVPESPPLVTPIHNMKPR